jgi:hypothetical protein
MSGPPAGWSASAQLDEPVREVGGVDALHVRFCQERHDR